MGLRSSLAGTPFRSALRQPLLRRRVQTDTASASQEQSSFAKFFNSPVGPKTVHFWCVHISPPATPRPDGQRRSVCGTRIAN